MHGKRGSPCLVTDEKSSVIYSTELFLDVHLCKIEFDSSMAHRDAADRTETPWAILSLTGVHDAAVFQ